MNAYRTIIVRARCPKGKTTQIARQGKTVSSKTTQEKAADQGKRGKNLKKIQNRKGKVDRSSLGWGLQGVFPGGGGG